MDAAFLERAERVLRPIERPRPRRADWEAFLHFARCEHRLALARHLFTPEEVAGRILEQVRVSRGERRRLPEELRRVYEETEKTLPPLPGYEAALLAALQNEGRIYWVSDATPSEIGSLVEYPPGTVALFVKPPGSCLEFELKRAGRRGPLPLSAVFEKDGVPVTVSHRLDGGSMRVLLEWEAYASALLAEVYRRVHSVEAPLSRIRSLLDVISVPGEDGEVPLAEYFERLGDRFPAARDAIERSVAAFRKEEYPPLPDSAAGRGPVLEFLGRLSPAQAILSHTSSLRVDRAARYLADGGKRLADDVLEEVLGLYTPPPERYRSHSRYVAAALAIPENRLRADAIYREALRDMGRLWGTLMGLGGGSEGESFVARNVGLKSVWEDGRWTARLISMDHDALRIGEFTNPRVVSRSMRIDEQYLLETLGLLADIYQVDPAVREDGLRSFRESVLEAFEKVREGVFGNLLDGFLDDWTLQWVREWTKPVVLYLRKRRGAITEEAWKEQTEGWLSRWVKQEADLGSYLSQLVRLVDLLERYSLLGSIRD